MNGNSILSSMILERDFYTREDVVTIAQELLGKVLFSNIDQKITAGIITEVEAYCGRNDKACHANNNLRTARTEIMYQEGGKAYVYLCYGIHHLFNVVTNREGMADAVLIRALKPYEGVDTMLKRRKMNNKNISGGPGTLTQAMGIKTLHNKTDLLGNKIWIQDKGIKVPENAIQVSERIGVDYAGEDAKKPWRFLINDV